MYIYCLTSSDQKAAILEIEAIFILCLANFLFLKENSLMDIHAWYGACLTMWTIRLTFLHLAAPPKAVSQKKNICCKNCTENILFIIEIFIIIRK